MALRRANRSAMQLRDFQREDVDQIEANGFRALIANAPGTGKTATSLSCIGRAPGRLLPALVVCPASVVRNWRKEVRMWTPGLKTHIIEDTSTPLPSRPIDVYITSWALLTHRWRELGRIGIQLVIGDEIHFAKNDQAMRTQAMASLWHLLLLSGTPIINDTEELEAINSLFGERRPIMIRRLLEDVAKDIPPKQRARLNIDLPEKIRSRYRSAEQDFAAWLEKELSTRMDGGEARDAASRALAAEALIKIGYLRRILATGKVYAAADWTARVVRAGEQVVLFAEHKAVISKLQHLLRKQGIPFVLIDGSTSMRDRQRAVDMFQNHKIPVFIGSKAAKEGLTLTAARHLLFVERYWTSAEEEQGEDRIRRIGQTHATKIWFVHCPGTVDDRISTIIERKRRIVRQAIGAAVIAETPEANVASILSQWNEHAGAPAMDSVDLGTTEPLPPLPRPSIVHALRFRGTRWTPEGALKWAKMMGYRPKRSQPTKSGFELIVNPANTYKDGSFALTRVARDIAICTGVRVPAR
ncbi:DEAD/DEAH box helicase [bacterium]|nr:DEAD/DEAH box helicase [bacterium]